MVNESHRVYAYHTMYLVFQENISFTNEQTELTSAMTLERRVVYITVNSYTKIIKLKN